MAGWLAVVAVGLVFENCIVGDVIVARVVRWWLVLPWWWGWLVVGGSGRSIFVAKLCRAHGGCLGIRSR